MKTRDKALRWFNLLGRTKREELSIDYYGSTLLDDVEIIEMYFEEVPHYSSKEVITLLGEARIADINGGASFSLENWIKNNLIYKL